MRRVAAVADAAVDSAAVEVTLRRSPGRCAVRAPSWRLDQSRTTPTTPSGEEVRETVGTPCQRCRRNPVVTRGVRSEKQGSWVELISAGHVSDQLSWWFRKLGCAPKHSGTEMGETERVGVGLGGGGGVLNIHAWP